MIDHRRRPVGRGGALAVLGVVAAAVVAAAVFLPGRGPDDPSPSSGGATLPPDVTLPPISPPAILATGRLAPAAGQTATGDVTLVRQPDRSVIVRLDRLDLAGATSAAAYLVGGGATRPDGGTLLGRLTSERTSFNLPVPAGTEPGPGATVLLWSESAQRALASATLRPV